MQKKIHKYNEIGIHCSKTVKLIVEHNKKVSAVFVFA